MYLTILKVLLVSFVLSRVSVHSEKETHGSPIKNAKVNFLNIHSDYCSILSSFCDGEIIKPRRCKYPKYRAISNICTTRSRLLESTPKSHVFQPNKGYESDVCHLLVSFCEENPSFSKCLNQENEVSRLCKYIELTSIVASQLEVILEGSLMEIKPKSDICAVSKAMQNSGGMEVKSYQPLSPVDFPSKSIPHASFSLCKMKNAGNLSRRNPTIDSVFVFKAARTGSTFFSSVLKNNLKDATVLWEPFGTKRCFGESLEADYQEKGMYNYLTHGCNLKDKCIIDYCHGNKPNLPIIAANSRFFNDQLHWDKVFENSMNGRIVLLRRTNLVLMSYSKHHHGSCRINGLVYDSHKFTLNNLLLCVEHYALGDQEIGASRALHAAEVISESPFLVLYEDVLSQGGIVEQKLLQHLGVGTSSFIGNEDVFEENNGPHKLHSLPFCDNNDVICDDLEKGLKDEYPCLYKQLVDERKGYSWTTPMLKDGSINMKGDCHPLPYLSKANSQRMMEDIYQFDPN